MVRITKVYTRRGDTGTTTVLGPERIPKTSREIKTLGALDEVNAYIGWTLIALQSDDIIQKRLLEIQNDLFDLGAYLCNPANVYPHNLAERVNLFEEEIDHMNESLSALTSFILPGGTEIAARLHITRTIVRRCEITLVSLAKQRPVKEAIPYLNRLSDWLFVAARFVNHQNEVVEPLWQAASGYHD